MSWISQKKKVTFQSNVHSPLPIPIRGSQTATTTWPLKEPSVIPFFTGIFSSDDKSINVLCGSAGQCLYNMGYFGRTSSKLNYGYSVSEPLSLDDVIASRKSRVSFEKERLQSQSLDKFVKQVCHDPIVGKCLVEDLYSCKDKPTCMYHETVTSQDEAVIKLFLEEAFFLSYGLGNLMIKTRSEAGSLVQLNLQEIWHLFCNSFHDKKRFVVTYAAYHYFRSRGWIVKQGRNYGSDFVLYKEGPSSYHSLFSVVVTRVDEQGRHPKPSLQYLNGLQRVSENVSKLIVICDVTLPSIITSSELKLPTVIRKLEIDCTVIERWTGISDKA